MHTVKRPDQFTLAEFRKRLGCSQVEMADALGTTQSGISRIERQSDIMLSTLSRYVSALGGQLRIVVDHETGPTEIVNLGWDTDDVH